MILSLNPRVERTGEACEKIVGVTRIFLKSVFAEVAKAAIEKGVIVITPEFMDKVRNKRNSEKTGITGILVSPLFIDDFLVKCQCIFFAVSSSHNCGPTFH